MTEVALTPGQSFAGYRVDGVVARGGMGVVYHQYDPGRRKAGGEGAEEPGADEGRAAPLPA